MSKNCSSKQDQTLQWARTDAGPLIAAEITWEPSKSYQPAMDTYMGPDSAGTNYEETIQGRLSFLFSIYDDFYFYFLKKRKY